MKTSIELMVCVSHKKRWRIIHNCVSELYNNECVARANTTATESTTKLFIQCLTNTNEMGNIATVGILRLNWKNLISECVFLSSSFLLFFVFTTTNEWKKKYNKSIQMWVCNCVSYSKIYYTCKHTADIVIINDGCQFDTKNKRFALKVSCFDVVI